MHIFNRFETDTINNQLQSLEPKELEKLLKYLDQLEHWDGSIPLKDFINELDDGGEGL